MKLLMRKTRSILKRSIDLMLLVLLCIILGLMISVAGTEAYSKAKNAALVSNGALMIPVVCCIALMSVLYRKRERIDKLSTNHNIYIYIYIGIATLLLYCVQQFIASNIYFLTGWDVGGIREASDLVLAGDTIQETTYYDYLQRYPNNQLLFLFTVFFKKIAGIIGLNADFFLSSIIMLLIAASVGMTSSTAYKLTKSGFAAGCAWVISALSFGLSPWMIIPYSDGIAIFFCSLSLWLYTVSQGIKWEKGEVFKAVMTLLPSLIGYLFKPQCAIFAVALVIVRLLEERKIRIKEIVSVIVSLVLFLGISGMFDLICEQKYGLKQDKDKAFSMTHFMMMGMNNETCGGYLGEDVKYTASFPTKEEKMRANVEVIRQRLDEFGSKGYIRFLSQKMMKNYNDGTFAWGREGSFYKQCYEEPFGKVSQVLRSVLYTNGSRYGLFATMEQGIWLFMLICTAIAAALRDHSRCNTERSIVFLCLIGITLFTLLFEARARYLFLYAPYYVIGCVLGIDRLSRVRNNEK